MDGVKIAIIGLSTLFVGGLILLTAFPETSPPPKTEKSKFNTSFSYSPDLCSPNAQGMVYFATGETVFRVPYKDLLSIRGMSDEEKALLPKRPNPNEPEGCLANPVWGGGFSIKFRYSLKTENAAKEKETQIKFTLVNAPRGPYTGTSGIHKKTFERLEEYKKCTETEPGIINCRKPDRKVTADFEYTAYKVGPEAHKTPTGNAIYISCFGLTHEKYGQECGVSYQLQESLGIFYDFYRAQLPINEFIEYDKALRQYIADSQVKNYQWGK